MVAFVEKTYGEVKKMSVLNLLSEACERPAKRQKKIQYKAFDNLPVGEYKIKYMQIKPTEYGDRIHVFIENFFIILPERFNKKLNQINQIEELNNKKLKMVFSGKDKQNYNFLKLEFKEYSSESDDGDDDGGVDDKNGGKKETVGEEVQTDDDADDDGETDDDGEESDDDGVSPTKIAKKN